MNSLYELPETIEIDGKEYPIRTDFRAIIDVLIAFNDPDLSDEAKIGVCLNIVYLHPETIPEKHMEEALRKAYAFIDCGEMPEEEKSGKLPPRLIDWEQDAKIIIPAINKSAGIEVRSKKMHWWTFIGYFMEIGESYFANVVNIRKKMAEHKKLEKYEKDFYKEYKKDIDFKKNTKAERSDEEKDALKELWGD